MPRKEPAYEYIYRVTAKPTEFSRTTRRLNRTPRSRRAVAQIIAANEALGPRPPTHYRNFALKDRREELIIERAIVGPWEVIPPELVNQTLKQKMEADQTPSLGGTR